MIIIVVVWEYKENKLWQGQAILFSHQILFENAVFMVTESVMMRIVAGIF